MKRPLDTIPSELDSVLVVGNIVEYKLIETTRIYINSIFTANALRVDYKNILKVYDKNGNIVWRKSNATN